MNRGIEPVFGTQSKQLSLIYGPELARAIIEAALSERTTGETYYVSDPIVYPLTEALAIAARILGRRTIKVRLPSPLLYTIAGLSELALSFSRAPSTLNVEKARDLLQTHWVCNSERFENHTGFRNRVSLEEGLKATISWYKEFGWL